jgi:hypothetical protein
MAPNIRKLTAGFLAFAALAAMFSLGLSALSTPSSSSRTHSATASLDSRTGGNAFIPKERAGTPSLAEGGTPGSQTARAASSNLTLRLGNLLAREVIATNDAIGTLNGPPTGLATPKKKVLENAIQSGLAATDGRAFLPRFDEPVPDRTLTILAAPTAEQFARYSDETARKFSETVGSAAFENLLVGTPSLENAYAATAVYGNLAQSLTLTPVPQPLVGFHKSIIAAVRNRKTLVDLALGDSSDPLKSLAAIHSLEGRIGDILARDTENFEREVRRLQDLSFTIPIDTRSFAERIFGIERAFAQIPLGATANIGQQISKISGPRVPVNDPSLNKIASLLTGKEIEDNTRNWLRRLWEFAQKVLLQELKNQLIALLQQQIVNWINGGGKPQFVTDWKGFVGDAFNNAAGAAIEKYLPELCMPLSAQLLINITLRSPVVPVYTGCTLNQVVSNVKNFANDFRNGGWLQYSVTLQPTGNYFGSLIEVHDAALFAGLAASDAAKNKALAGGGFLGSEVCPSTGKPPFDEAAGFDTNGCPGGEQPITRTPGKVLGDTLTKGLNLPSELIVNATDIAGLVAVVTDAALTRLISVGLTAAGKATGKGLSDVPPQQVPAATNTTAATAAQKASGDNPIAQPTDADVQSEIAKSGGVGVDENGFATENFLSTEASASKLDLSNAAVSQSTTANRDSNGDHNAQSAIDQSTYSYSQTGYGNPSWWEVTLPTPQRLDEIRITTYGGSYPLSKYGNPATGPFLTLIESKGGKETAWRINLPDRTQNKNIILAAEQAHDAITGNSVIANTVNVSKVKIEASILLLVEVELFRHMLPEVDISKVPGSLTKADAANLDPLQWVSAIYYPAHNNPQLAPSAAITVEIFESRAEGGRMAPLIDTLDENGKRVLRYRLAPGSYRFTYTAEVSGEKSAPKTRTVTVTQ